MKEKNFFNKQKNNFYLHFRRIISFDIELNSNLTSLNNKFRISLLFYLILIVMSLLNINFYLNSVRKILDQIPSNFEESKNNLNRNLTQAGIIRRKLNYKTKFNLEMNKKLSKNLIYLINVTDQNILSNLEPNNSSKLSMMLIIIFLLKIIITLGFFVNNYFSYKQLKRFSNKKFMNIKNHFSQIHLSKDEKEKSQFHSNFQFTYAKSSFYQNSFNILKIKNNDNDFNSIDITNCRKKIKLINTKKIFITKARLIHCITFFNSFDLTFQFLIFVNWILNFNTNQITNCQFNMVYLPLVYSTIICLYFNIFDFNLKIYFSAKFINCLIFVIFEKLKMTNISFFNNLIYLIIFWVVIFFVIIKINIYEIRLMRNKIKSERNKKINEKDLLNVNNGNLIINLTEDKAEVIDKEFKESLENNFYKLDLENIISFPNKWFEDYKHDKNKEFKNLTLTSFKNIEEQNSKENELLKNHYYQKNSKEIKINFDENSFRIKAKNDIYNNDKYHLNNNNELYINKLDLENSNINLKKKFIFNNLNFFKILLEISDFNFNLNEKIIELYINIRKTLKQYKFSNKYDQDIKSENVINIANNKNELLENEKNYFEKFKNYQNFEDNTKIKSSFNKIKDQIPIKKDLELDLTKDKLINNNIDNHLSNAKNKFDILKINKNEKSENNNGHVGIKSNKENSMKKFPESLLVEKLINFFKLLQQEVVKKKNSVFLGIIKNLDEKSDKDLIYYGIRLFITENKKFMILKINEIQNEVKFVEMKTEFKFKNLYLKKFCHEFKNPLLNVLQLVKNFKQIYTSKSKEYISSFSRNIQLSQQTSSLSNISNNLKNQKTLYKKSSKNFWVLENNKSSTSNLSPISGEFYNQNELHKSRKFNTSKEIQSENLNNIVYNKLKIENNSISPKNDLNKYSISAKKSKNLTIEQYSSNKLEGENFINDSSISEKIKLICENLILAITDMEFLIEFSNKNIKKLEDLYELENLSPIISDDELFDINFEKETFNSFNECENVYEIAGNKNKDETNVNISKLIQYFTRLFGNKINLIGKKITLFTDIQACIPDKILFNEKKLKQIIFNLLSNALKFTNYGKIGIILEYNEESKNLIFYITDHGIGISCNIINKIGEPYFKTNKNNNDFGIGMGIYLVKKLVKSLNGEFKIESEINKGTTIIVQFPYDFEQKSRIYEESIKNLEIKLSKFKYRDIFMINSGIEQENAGRNFFKNTELKLKSLNRLKTEYEFYDKDNLVCNPKDLSKSTDGNLILTFNDKLHLNTSRDNIGKHKFHSQQFSFNAKNFKNINQQYEESDKLANKTIFKHINQNITFDIRDFSYNNTNIDNVKQKNKNEYSNDLNKDKRKTLVNFLIGRKNPQISPVKTASKRSFSCKTLRIFNIFNNENNNDNKEKINKLNLTIVNPIFNRIKLNPYYNNNSNLYFINNVTNNELDIFNSSYENSSGGETLIVDDSFMNKNLNSLKNEQEMIFIDIHKKSRNKNFKTFDLNLRDSPTPRITDKDNGYYNCKKNVKSGKNSNFESNLEWNDFSNKNLNIIRNENESNSIYFVNDKLLSSNDVFKIDYSEIGRDGKKINQNKDLTLTIGSETSNKENTIREKFNSEISSKFQVEKNESLYNSDIHSKFHIKKDERLNNSDSSRKFHIEKERQLHNSDSTKKSHFENKFRAQDSNAVKQSFFLKKGNYLDDGDLMIFTENKNSNNLYVIVNNQEHLYYHKISNNVSKIHNLQEEFILSSRSLDKLKGRIPNFDINSGWIISKENFKNISNIIEKKYIGVNINTTKEDVMRILIVDDEQLIRQSQINLIKKYSEKNNILIEIEECEDGIECLYKIFKGLQKGIKYNLIITDETMNFLKGSFMAKILKKLISEDVIYKIKIIMVTSYATENYAHMNGNFVERVFSKPLSFNIIENIFNS